MTMRQRKRRLMDARPDMVGPKCSSFSPGCVVCTWYLFREVTGRFPRDHELWSAQDYGSNFQDATRESQGSWATAEQEQAYRPVMGEWLRSVFVKEMA